MSTNINSASAGKHLVVVNNSNSNSAINEDILNKALGPAMQTLGVEFAAFIDQKINKKDAENIRMNIDPVVEKIGKINPDDLSSDKKEKLFEWMKKASTIDPKKNKEFSAAWQAAIADVISNDDHRMMDIVKNFNAYDIKRLLMINNYVFEDRNFGRKLEILGLADNNLYDGTTSYKFVRKISFLVGLSIVAVSLQEFMPSYLLLKTTNLDGNKNMSVEELRLFLNSLKWAIPISSAIIILPSIRSYMNKILSFRLNSLGIEIRKKIIEFMPRD